MSECRGRQLCVPEAQQVTLDYMALSHIESEESSEPSYDDNRSGPECRREVRDSSDSEMRILKTMTCQLLSDTSGDPAGEH